MIEDCLYQLEPKSDDWDWLIQARNKEELSEVIENNLVILQAKSEQHLAEQDMVFGPLVEKTEQP
jgi:hypothetical protein